MSKNNGFEMTSLNPGWIKRRVPDSYADESLNRIILFFVIYTPCIDLSSSRLPLTEYGWGKNVWQNDVLKNVLLDQANLKRGETFVIAKSINDMKNACETARLKKGFHNNRENERIAIYKPSKYNEFMSVFYHIRNALAHGRLAMYPIGDGVDITFALEAGVKKNEEFQVRSRMILRKSTLINWIEIIQAGPLGTL